MTLSCVVEPGMGIMVGNPLRPLYDRTLTSGLSIRRVRSSSKRFSLDDSDFKFEYQKITLRRQLTMQELFGPEYNLSLSLLSGSRFPSVHSSPDCQLRTEVDDVECPRDQGLQF